MKMKKIILFGLSLSLSLSLSVISLLPTQAISAGNQDNKLVVYTSRSKHLIEPFFKKYQKETGTTIEYINSKAPVLRQRLKTEGKNTPADLLMTVDAGNLWQATEEDLLAPLDTTILSKRVPSYLIDKKNRWVALTIRARTMVYSPQRVNTNQLNNYIRLADPQWKGRLCLRTSKKVYNQSLVAMLINHYGEEKVEQAVNGWVNNLASPPYAKDSHVIQAIANGKCDVGLVNTYYYGRKLLKNKDYADKVKLFWASQKSGEFGTHINVSGIGITKYSKNKVAAQKFIEWLVSDAVQNDFAGINLEHPVNLDTSNNVILKSWGKFKADQSPLYLAGKYQQQAVRLMDRAGYK